MSTCMEQGNRWYCSLEKGHTGNHIAYDSHNKEGEKLEEWENNPNRKKPENSCVIKCPHCNSVLDISLTVKEQEDA